MSSIDNRVVEMDFDDSKFKKGVKSTIDSLNQLDNSLILKNGAKSLDGISRSVGNVADATKDISGKFNAMGVVGFTAISRITNAAMDCGKQIVKSLTVQPLLDGFHEYETKLGSIQTILANTQGKSSLKDVNNVLDDLNTYADKTIYNFSEMTRNIGTFTAAGVGLEKSASAIKGIANLAASSGSSSQQASVAMYQLSQAIANGKVNLQDWNSVVNAGMGGKLFQNALQRTAENFGTNVDAIIKKYGSFRESLSKGEWLTSDVLTETLKQFSGAYNERELILKGYTEEQAKDIVKMADVAEKAATKVKTFSQLIDTTKEALGSGWTQSWEYIIGDFEQSRTLWTDVSNVINTFIGTIDNARNGILKFWSETTGREMLLEGLKDLFNGLARMAKTASEAFRHIIPPVTSKAVVNITVQFRKFAETLRLFASSQYGNIYNTFRGIAQILKFVLQVVTALAKAVGTILVAAFKMVINILGTVTSVVGSFLDGLFGSQKGINNFSKALQKLADMIAGVFKQVTKFFGKFAQAKRDDYLANSWQEKGVSTLRGLVKQEKKILEARKKAYEAASKSKDKDAIAKTAKSYEESQKLLAKVEAKYSKTKAMSSADYVTRMVSAQKKSSIAEYEKTVKESRRKMSEIEQKYASNGVLDANALPEDVKRKYFSSLEEYRKARQKVQKLSKQSPDNYLADKIKKDTASYEKLKKLHDKYTDDYLAQGKKLNASQQKQYDEFYKMRNRLSREKTMARTISGNTEQYTSLSQAANAFGKVINKVWTGVTGILLKAVNIASSAAKNIGKAFTSLVKMASGPVNSAFKFVSKAVSGLYSSVEKAAGKIPKIFSGVPEAAGTAAMKIGDALHRAFGTVSSSLAPLGDSVKSSFGPIFGNIANTIGPALKTLLNAIGDNAGPVIDSMAKGIADFLTKLSKLDLSPVAKMLERIGKAFGTFFESIATNGFSPNDLLQLFGDLFSSLKDGATGTGDSLGRFFSDLTGFSQPLQTLSDILSGIVDHLKSITGFIKPAVAQADELGSSSGEVGDNLNNAGNALNDFLTNVSTIKTTLKNPNQAIQNFADNVDLEPVFAMASGIFTGSMLVTMYRMVDAIRKVPESISKIGNSISGFITAMTPSKLQKNATAMLTIAGSIAVLAGSLYIISGIETDKLLKAGVAVGVLVVLMTASIKILDLGVAKMKPEKIEAAGERMIAMAVALGAMAASIFVVAAACDKLKDADWETMAKAGAILIGLIAAMAAVSAIEYFLDPKSLGKAALLIMAIAVALSHMALAFDLFAAMDTETFETGGKRLLMVSAGLFAFVAGIAAIMGVAGTTSLAGVAASIVAISLALIVMSAACVAFTAVPVDGMVKASLMLLTVAAAISLIAAVIGKMKTAAISLAAISVTMLAFATSMIILGAAFAMVSATMSSNENAVHAFISIMASMTISIAALAVVTAGLTAIDMAAVAATFVAFGASMLILAGALTVLSLIPADRILVSVAVLVSLTTVLVGLGAVVGMLPEIAGGMLIFTEALAVFAVSALVISVSLGIFTMALTALAAVAPIAAASLGSALQIFADKIAAIDTVKLSEVIALGLAMGLLTPVIIAVSLALIALTLAVSVLSGMDSEGIQNAVTNIGIAIKGLATAAAEAMNAFALKISEGIYQVITYMSEHAQDFGSAAANLIANFINGIASNIGNVINAAFALLISFIDGFATAIDENHDALWDACAHLVTSIITAIGDGASKLVQSGADLFNNFISGFQGGNAEQAEQKADDTSKNVTASLDKSKDASAKGAKTMDAYAKSISSGSKSAEKEFNGILKGLGTGTVDTSKIEKLGDQVPASLARGESKGAHKTTDEATKIKKQLSSAFSGSGDMWKDDGSNIVGGLISGLGSKMSELQDTVDSIGEKMKKDFEVHMEIHSPSKVFAWEGNMIMAGLMLGLMQKKAQLSATMRDLSYETIDAYSSALKPIRFSNLYDGLDRTPTIRPVLDLTNVRNGVNELNGLIPSTSTISAYGVGFQRGIPGIQNGKVTNNAVSITLDYKAGADANQIVRDIAIGLEKLNNMEGR